MTFLESAIGLVFVLAFLSLICSAIQEMLSAWSDSRAKILKLAVANLLNSGKPPADGAKSNSVSTDFYQHPLIAALSRSGDPAKHHPSYIPSRVFASALIDLVIERAAVTAKANSQPWPPMTSVPAGAPANTMPKPVSLVEQFKAALVVTSGEMPALVRWLRVVTVEVEQDFEQLKTRIAAHVDTVMERASGWYKRKTMWQLSLVSLGVAIATNADLFMIGDAFARNSTLRVAVVHAAEQVAAKPPDEKDPAGQRLRAVVDQSKDVKLPLGWTPDDPERNLPKNVRAWLRKIIGLLLAVAAMTLGAPFWFDALKNLVGLRGAGAAPKPATGG